MNCLLSPESPTELAEAVRSAPRVLAVGAGTKPRLSQVADDVVRISTTKLRGIVEYEPSEFTFTALAGTPVREIAAALAERGQYLPFDPLLAEAGATLGGTVAAGVSGPGRFRFGGLRDFILGVRFVDGGGRLMRLGGKVVKNAAGFDLPKFFVGSLGRFGALAEITFKVFPRPLAMRTLRLEAKDAAAMAEIFATAGSARWELDALEALPGEGAVYARLAGPAVALDALATEMLARWKGIALADGDAAIFWRDATEMAWTHTGGSLVKIALTPSQVSEFVARIPTGARVRIGAGGSVGYRSLPAAAPAGPLEWIAMTLRGDAPLWPGKRPRFAVMAATKTALDPQNRFPQLDD
jgi:glycolate oxidase FAD binding subunit